MKIEIDIEELIGNALDGMDSSDYFDCVDMNDLVSSRLADMSNDSILEDVDVEELVRDRISDISDSDILEGVDVESLVKDEIDSRDIMDDIDIEKIIVDHISRSLGEDDFRQYIVSLNDIRRLQDSMTEMYYKYECLHLETVRVKDRLDKLNSKKWYQIW